MIREGRERERACRHYFNLINEGILKFKCVVLDKQKINEKTLKIIRSTSKKEKDNKNNKNGEIKSSVDYLHTMLGNLYSGILREDIPEKNSNIYFFHDSVDANYNLDSLKKTLIKREKEGEKKYGFQYVKSVEYLDSKKSNFIQIADFLVGAQ